MPQSLYTTLELQKGAEPSEVRKAYLRLSRIYHPDKAPAEKKEEYEVKFKEVSRAYEVLSDEQKRSFYDQTGQVPGEQGSGDQGGGFPGGGMPFPFDIGGLFGMFGGGRGGPGGPQRGRRPGKAPPKKTQIPLGLKDFYYGRTLHVHLERQRFCGPCKGEGSTDIKSCQECSGTGIKRQIIQMGPMIMDNTGPCTTCTGTGKLRGDSCSNCKGSKFIKQDKALELVITKGMKPGETVVFGGESSNVEEWEEPGDVIVEVVAADEDHGWERFGDQLKHRVGLTLAESLCGKTVKLDGHPAHPQGLYIHIPGGVVNRQEIVVEGCGMPRALGGGYGDAVLVLTVLATAAERHVLEQNRLALRTMFEVGEGETVPAGTTAFQAKPLVY